MPARLQVRDPALEFVCNIRALFGNHTLYSSEAPVRDVNADVRRLNGTRELRVHEHRNRHDRSRTEPPWVGSREVPFDLTNEMPVSRFVRLIEDKQPRLPPSHTQD